MATTLVLMEGCYVFESMDTTDIEKGMNDFIDALNYYRVYTRIRDVKDRRDCVVHRSRCTSISSILCVSLPQSDISSLHSSLIIGGLSLENQEALNTAIQEVIVTHLISVLL